MDGCTRCLKKSQGYEREFMKIKANKFNEVRISDVAKYIELPSQIIRSECSNGVPLGYISLKDGSVMRLYSGDEVRINNVQLPLAAPSSFPFAEKEDEFNCEIEINDCF